MAPVSPLLAWADATAAEAALFAALLGARGTTALLQLQANGGAGGSAPLVAAGAALSVAAAAVDTLAGSGSAAGTVLLTGAVFGPQPMAPAFSGAVPLTVRVGDGSVTVACANATARAPALLRAAVTWLEPAGEASAAAADGGNGTARLLARLQSLLSAAALAVPEASPQPEAQASALLAAPGAPGARFEPSVATACQLQACLELPQAGAGLGRALVASAIEACVLAPRGGSTGTDEPRLCAAAGQAAGGRWRLRAAAAGATCQLLEGVRYSPLWDAAEPLVAARALQLSAATGGTAAPLELEAEEFTYSTVWEVASPAAVDDSASPQRDAIAARLAVLPGTPAALRAVAALQQAGTVAAGRPPRLHAATSSALAAAGAGPNRASTNSAAGSAAWGALRAAALEQRGWSLSALDDDAAAPSASTPGSALELLLDAPGSGSCSGPRAASVYGAALRGGAQLVARLRRAPASAEPQTTPVAGAAAGGLDPAGTYIITGGTGYVGAQVARWLLQRVGVKHVHLVSRSGRVPAELSDLIIPAAAGDTTGDSSNGGGARNRLLTASCADAACGGDMAAAAAAAASACGLPVLGVMHAAGVLDDGLLGSLTARSVRRVEAPKAPGLHALMAALHGSPLVGTVLFSSVAALLGSPGQANYSAANAAMDEAAGALIAGGVAAVSVQWGAWAGAGMAAADPQTAARAARLGMGLIAPAQALATLETALAGCCSAAGASSVGLARLAAPGQLQAVATLAAVPIGWPAFLLHLPRQPPEAFFSDFAQKHAAGAAAAALAPAGQLAAAGDAADSGDAAAAAVRARRAVEGAIETVLGAPVPGDAPLMAAGLDSLGAVELRSLLEEALGSVPLPPTLIFDAPTPAALTAAITAQLLGGAAAGAPAAAARLPKAPAPLAAGAPPAALAVAAAAGRCAAGAAAPEVAPLGAGASDPVGLVPLDRWDVEAIPASVLAARWAPVPVSWPTWRPNSFSGGQAACLVRLIVRVARQASHLLPFAPTRFALTSSTCCATLPLSLPLAGLAPSCPVSRPLTRLPLASPPPRRPSWTPSSACCWRQPPRHCSPPGASRRSAAAPWAPPPPWAHTWASPRLTMAQS
jgi:hypothetical protein